MASQNDGNYLDDENLQKTLEEIAIAESIEFELGKIHENEPIQQQDFIFDDRECAERLQRVLYDENLASDLALCEEIQDKDVKILTHQYKKSSRETTVSKLRPNVMSHRLRVNPENRRINSNSSSHALESNDRDFGPEDYDRLLELDKDQKKASVNPEKLKQLPLEKFQKARNRNPEENQCSICFEDFLVGESLRRLSCFHLYHKNCIDRWLKEDKICPICRLPAIE